MSGPAPKHPSRRARRNNPRADFTSLPTEGRKGAPPAWPLLPDPSLTAQLDLATDRVANLQAEIADAEDGRTKGRLRRQLMAAELLQATSKAQLDQAADLERELWAESWSTPQATMWDQSSAFRREVASYVRWQVKSEQGSLDAAKEARMRSDRLGLNPLALLRLRAEVEKAEEAEDRGRRRRGSGAPAPSASAGTESDGGDPRGLYAV